MSSHSLVIAYARATCDRAQVQTVLFPLVGMMDRIDETTRKDSKGYDYKMFFIHFAVNNPELDNVVARIGKEDFINIVYDTQWDKRKWNDDTQRYGADVDRYWKVTLYAKKDKPVTATAMPHIMSVEDAALLRANKAGTLHNDSKLNDSGHDSSQRFGGGSAVPQSRRRKIDSA